MSYETTLRECPFCGGETWEPLSRRWKNAVGDISYSAYVHCPECEFSIETKSCGYETAEEAIEAATEAWNTRATLGSGTCRWQSEKHGPLYDVFSCSACGYEYAESRTDMGATDLTPNFCPNCGRKVVNE